MTVADLRPYPEYGPAVTARLRSFPSHWEVQRAKVLLREVDERSKTGDEELLSVSHKTGVTPRRMKQVTMFLAESNVGHKVCRPGDVVVNTMWAWMAAVGVAKDIGIVSPSYAVYRPRTGTELQDRFLDGLLRSAAYRDEYLVRSTGITSSRLRLYSDEFLSIPLPVPPQDEQVAIVRFLDHADNRIRRYIRAKQQLIRLLEEQKQSIIYRAVTRGLDPDVRLKPSGVEWLGDIPRHWNVTRVKAEFRCLNNRRVPLSATERGEMSLGRYDYYGASGVIDQVDDFLFDDDLLLIAEDGANLVLRNLPLAIVARGRFWVNNHAHILKPRRGNLEYLAALMETLNYQPWISGAAQPKLTKDRLLSINISVPPRDEQDHIVAKVQDETGALRATIDRARRELDLLKEYRSRLIADVVTGKLDVREAAAGLPEELDPFEDDELELEAKGADDDLDPELEEAAA